VRLPLGAHVAEPAAAAEPAAPSDATKRVVVVADDNADYAESTAMILRMDGHTAHVAYDGAQTLQVVENVRPDVVLLDIGLPKMSGYDVARRIRAMDGMEGILLVAITGWGQSKDRQLAHEAGFDRHLVKPVDPELLLQLVAQAGPRQASAGSGQGAPVPGTAQPRNGVVERVLLVDDNADVRASAADMLRDIGYEVETAADGGSAIELAERWRPRYVLVDLNMPLINGFEVARRLRARFAPTEMRLIMMSGVDLNEAMRTSAANAGFDGAVDKLAEPEQWAEALQMK
jgi:CheY-like chemotaxis protein